MRRTRSGSGLTPIAWDRTRNPWTILQNASAARLDELSGDRSFVDHLEELAAARRAHLERPGWFVASYGTAALAGIAYFSMEFGLSDALPLYAGGLGVLAGDFLKTASDLGVPAIGIGLLFQEGYFRQTIDAAGQQHEAYPYNEPATMPIRRCSTMAARGCASRSSCPVGRSSCASGRVPSDA